MSSKNIPQTDSIEELVQFWDKHDLTDFEEELEEVTEPVFDRDTVVTIHLSAKEAEAVKEIAKSKGIEDSDLLREWVLQRVATS